MDIPSEIRAIEIELKVADIAVADFCDLVGVNRATWQRWKNGTSAPSVTTWAKVSDGRPSAQPKRGRAA